MTTNPLPAEGYVRLSQIIGNPKKGLPGIIPISKTSWWDGCRRGLYPKGVKLGDRTTAWRVEDIRALITNLGGTSHG